MVLEKTKIWLKEVVIGLGLCPFVFEVYSKELIRYYEVPFQDATTFLSEFLSLSTALIESDSKETSLIIIPDGLEEFEDYMTVYEVLESYLTEQELDSEIQLASFHPHYCFAETEPDDVENYTNRSPYPIIHLLKVKEVEAAINAHPDISQVPKDNIARMNKMGKGGIEKLLQSIYS